MAYNSNNNNGAPRHDDRGYNNNNGAPRHDDRGYNNNNGAPRHDDRGYNNNNRFSNYNSNRQQQGNQQQQRRHNDRNSSNHVPHQYKYPPCTVADIQALIRPPLLSPSPTAHTILPDTPKTKYNSGDTRYRPNVAAHVFNEKGEYLACFRKDGKSWQCVQGGIEGEDVDLEQAALRELDEEVGLTPEAGLVYVGEIDAPSTSELRARRGPSDPIAGGDGSKRVLQDCEKEPDWTYFRYELPWYAGKRIREQGYVGQEQRQLLFFLPSKGIETCQLQPDPAKFGPDVKMEFKRVAWMNMCQFFPLVASHKNHIFAYVFDKTPAMISDYLMKNPQVVVADAEVEVTVATPVTDGDSQVAAAVVSKVDETTTTEQQQPTAAVAAASVDEPTLTSTSTTTTLVDEGVKVVEENTETAPTA